MNLLFGLIRGYYYPSKAAGLHSLSALANAVRLAIKCMKDN